jgi:hypothetical protein
MFMKTSLTFLTFLTLLVACLSIAGCLGAEGVRRPVFHTLQFSNAGKGAVSDVAVNYGDVLLPTGSVHTSLVPSPMTLWSEGEVLRVPNSVRIHWLSSGNAVHDVEVPLGQYETSGPLFFALSFLL